VPDSSLFDMAQEGIVRKRPVLPGHPEVEELTHEAGLRIPHNPPKERPIAVPSAAVLPGACRGGVATYSMVMILCLLKPPPGDAAGDAEV